MPTNTPAHTDPDFLRPLLNAIASRRDEAILAAIPEPPFFLPALFRLNPSDRDTVFAAVFSVLDIDDDQWEIIEAAAMDSVVRPERGAFIAVARHIPVSLLDDTRKLVESLPNPELVIEARRALEARIASLGVAR